MAEPARGARARDPGFAAAHVRDLGPDRRLLYNDGYAAILGERHPAALGEPFAVVWPDLTEVAASVLDRVYDGEALQVDDTTFSMIRNGQPEEVHFNYSATPVRDEAGRVNGIFCVCMETTAAARMQAAAQAERERLEALWQQAPGEVVITRGPEHLIEFANAAYLEGVGNRPVIGKTARQAVPELEGQGLFELLDEVYRTGEPFVGRQVPITLHRAPGGEPFTRYADFVYQPITDEAGAVTGIFVQGHDVTDAKASQAALQESEARFRLFSEESREGVVLHDGDTILDCNPAYARMFGFDSMADAVGRPILDTLSQESIRSFAAKSRSASRSPSRSSPAARTARRCPARSWPAKRSGAGRGSASCWRAISPCASSANSRSARASAASRPSRMRCPASPGPRTRTARSTS
jgi:PAS domain-containing protein